MIKIPFCDTIPIYECISDSFTYMKAALKGNVSFIVTLICFFFRTWANSFAQSKFTKWRQCWRWVYIVIKRKWQKTDVKELNYSTLANLSVTSWTHIFITSAFSIILLNTPSRVIHLNVCLPEPIVWFYRLEHKAKIRVKFSF